MTDQNSSIPTSDPTVSPPIPAAPAPSVPPETPPPPVPVPPETPPPVPVPPETPPPVPVPPETPPPVPVPPETPPDPSATVGDIVLNPAETPPPVAPVFHQPTPEELAAFAPPPPIEAPAPAPSGSVFPQATGMGDKTVMSGVVLGTTERMPTIVSDAPPPPPREVKFEELPLKTQDEIRAGWLANHGTMDGFEFTQNNTPPANPQAPAAAYVDPGEKPAEPEVDISKLPLKTQAEMMAGKARLSQRKSDYVDVLDQVAKNDAARLEKGGAPQAGDMSYVEQKN